MRIVQAPSQDVIKGSVLTTLGDLVQRGVAVAERIASIGSGKVLRSSGIGTILSWKFNDQFHDVNSIGYGTKIIEIGPWDMFTVNEYKSVAHGLNFTNIIDVNGIITNDAGNYKYPISGNKGDTYPLDFIIQDIDSTNIRMRRHNGGYFNRVDFSSDVINRGKLFIFYVF